MKVRDAIHGLNVGYASELYERYSQNPASVDKATRAYFDQWVPAADGGTTRASAAIEKVVGAVNLAQAIRGRGHLAARLDPLGSAPPGDPTLEARHHGVTEEDLRVLPASLIGGPIAERSLNALDALQNLRQVYSNTTGYEYDHVQAPEERAWLRNAAESCRFRSPKELIDFKALLMRLTQVEVFERFLHRVFPGKTRFSIEGVDMMIPMLDEIIGAAAETEIHNILLGMAHRGRLNVLAHVLRKPYAEILAEFKDPVKVSDFLLALGWTGDVKYHGGATRSLVASEPFSLTISIAPNPSHLEHVNPVVVGMARAAGTDASQPGSPRFDVKVSLPILIHGDAAFPGQGVVAETLNLSRLHGYQTGGTIHIIANNQLGYTTEPLSDRSTLYASDLAKGFEIPIVHVNADDPEACIEAALLSFAYRARFQKDFLIDLIGYRRYGHNEGDDPVFTQPLMYQKITEHPSVRAIWAKTLTERQVTDEAWPEALVRRQTEMLQQLMQSFKPEESLPEPELQAPAQGMARRVKTSVAAPRLRELNEALLTLPEDFTPYEKVARLRERRRRALETLDEPAIDWPMAEELALASILADGIPIRLTGQDAQRGTFSHRHAVLHDIASGACYTPLQSIPQARAAFEVRNSPLSENAVIGFEYGYNIQAPSRLVIWEAQYGDFINGAQVMTDEFVISARAKWGQTPSLVMLLPHGHEGQGPDHSSGRVERFLKMAADYNVRIANCTTAAQYFHLLRRQALLLGRDPLPLVIMTPKSLLRHPRVLSSLRDLSEGKWQPVIDDVQAARAPEQVTRLVLCSGKLHIDLVTSELRDRAGSVALVRLEQLYPLPGDELRAVLAKYPRVEEVFWAQEEPENMGAWGFMRAALGELFQGRWPLHYVGRPRSSSPAEGSSAWHSINQHGLIEQVFNLTPATTTEENHIWLKRT